MGSLEVELPNGQICYLGTGLSDADRNAPPAIGAVVTFSYFSMSKDGIPRFPVFLRERPDVEWPLPSAPEAEGEGAEGEEVGGEA